MLRTIIAISFILSLSYSAFGAVGCTLNDPDRDIIRLFPEATNYKTEFISIEEKGGAALKSEIEEKLGDALDTVYESNDVPYAYYTVLSGRKIIGYVNGVNQKGTYGGMQLVLATDPNGVIADFYYQKITSPESKKFNDRKFCKKFVGLSLADFYQRDLSKEIECPVKESKDDFFATLRGIKKNLILQDEFKLKNRYDKIYEELKNERENKNADPNEK